MRFYYVFIQDQYGNPVKTFSSAKADGTPDTGALTFEIDATLTQQALSTDKATLTLWGIAPDHSTYRNWANPITPYTISVYGGMLKGLPLANPMQQGLLLQGAIFQCYTNWIGTAMTLSFVIGSDTGLIANPKCFYTTWYKQQKLSDFLNATLTASKIKKFAVDSLNKDIVPNESKTFRSNGLHNFMADLQSQTFIAINGVEPRDNMSYTYNGVTSFYRNDLLWITDHPSEPKNKTGTPKKIEFSDLIGQPAWVGPVTIQLYLVMRGDLSVLDILTLPETPVTTSAAALSQYNQIDRNGAAFQGEFYITELRHTGNSRSSNALDWMTIITVTPIMKAQVTPIVTIEALIQ